MKRVFWHTTAAVITGLLVSMVMCHLVDSETMCVAFLSVPVFLISIVPFISIDRTRMPVRRHLFFFLPWFLVAGVWAYAELMGSTGKTRFDLVVGDTVFYIFQVYSVGLFAAYVFCILASRFSRTRLLDPSASTDGTSRRRLSPRESEPGSEPVGKS